MPEEATQAEAGTATETEPAGATGTASATGTEDASSLEEAPSLEQIQGWKGFRLDDLSGGSVGKVEGVYVDATGGTPEWLLARMGRFGHYCLVPARDAVGVAGHVWVPYSRGMIRKAPRIKPGASVEREQETALLEHYDVASPDVGRGSDLAKREAGSVTARPA